MRRDLRRDMADYAELDVGDLPDDLLPLPLPPEHIAYYLALREFDSEAAAYLLMHWMMGWSEQHRVAAPAETAPGGTTEPYVNTWLGIDWDQVDGDYPLWQYQNAAAALYRKIAQVHGGHEATRIFATLGQEPTSTKTKKKKNRALLDIFNLPPPLGGNEAQPARRAAAANRYAKKQRLPQEDQFSTGHTDPENIRRRLVDVLPRTGRRGRPRKVKK
jgi:hypothetical protein